MRKNKNKRWILVATWLLTVLICLIVMIEKIGEFPARNPNPKISAVIAGKEINLQIADSEEERAKGLGGKLGLASNEGMLFEFQQPDEACFWMKDMQFSLDILWFDADKKLIYQQQNLAPNTFPQSFCPPSPASYVVEIKPRLIQLKLGDALVVQKQ